MSKIRLSESIAPGTPPDGKVYMYAKTDGKIYTKDDEGNESSTTGISELAEDTSPQLGGDLDMNSNNITAGAVTISPTELGYLDGVNSNIQTQLGTKIVALVEDTTPQLGGDLDLNDKYIQLKNEPGSDDTGSGIIISATVDANATGIGAALHIAADGHYEEADASANTTAPCTGIALETGTGTKKVLLEGIIRNDGWNWTTGPGVAGIIYLSETAGALTQTAPSTSEAFVQVVGYAITDDSMYFRPELAMVEVA